MSIAAIRAAASARSSLALSRSAFAWVFLASHSACNTCCSASFASTASSDSATASRASCASSFAASAFSSSSVILAVTASCFSAWFWDTTRPVRTSSIALDCARVSAFAAAARELISPRSSEPITTENAERLSPRYISRAIAPTATWSSPSLSEETWIVSSISSFKAIASASCASRAACFRSASASTSSASARFI